jgi:alpha-glucosidase (family GH31 glycosyl hydrolase)
MVYAISSGWIMAWYAIVSRIPSEHRLWDYMHSDVPFLTDMNEISNFADGDCDDDSDSDGLPAEVAESLVPPEERSAVVMAEATSGEQEKQKETAEPGLFHAIKDVTSSNEDYATLDEEENTLASTIDTLIEKFPEPPFTVNNPPYLINNAGKKRPLQYRSVAPDAIHHGGVYEYNTHNLYGHMECQATYKSLIDIYGSRKKPFILTRSSFVGSGKYTAKWLGDNGRQPYPCSKI